MKKNLRSARCERIKARCLRRAIFSFANMPRVRDTFFVDFGNNTPASSATETKTKIYAGPSGRPPDHMNKRVSAPRPMPQEPMKQTATATQVATATPTSATQ